MTNTNTITMPRSVVEQALEALQATGTGYEPPDQLRKEMLACRALRAALEQSQVEQETVGEAGPMPGTDGFTMTCFRASDVPAGTKLYTHPQPKRQPLTDEQIIGAVYGDTVGYSHIEFARAIERAHGIG